MTVFHAGTEMMNLYLSTSSGIGLGSAASGFLESVSTAMRQNSRCFIYYNTLDAQKLYSVGTAAINASTAPGGVWWHFRIAREESNSDGYSTGGTVSLGGSDGNMASDSKSRGLVRVVNREVLVYNNDTTSYETVASVPDASTVDINVRLDATNGFIRIYVNKFPQYYREGNVQMIADWGTQLDTLWGQGATAVSRVGGFAINELIVADEDTRYKKVISYTLDDAAGINDFTNDIDLINVINPTAGDSIYADSGERTITFSSNTNLSLASTEYIQNVSLVFKGFRAPAYNVKLAALVNDSDGGDSAEHGTLLDLSADSSSTVNIFTLDTNPATGLAWQSTDLTTYNLGIRTKPQ